MYQYHCSFLYSTLSNSFIFIQLFKYTLIILSNINRKRTVNLLWPVGTLAGADQHYFLWNLFAHMYHKILQTICFTIQMSQLKVVLHRIWLFHPPQQVHCTLFIGFIKQYKPCWCKSTLVTLYSLYPCTSSVFNAHISHYSTLPFIYVHHNLLCDYRENHFVC